MQYILIYSLLFTFSSVLTISTTRAVNAEHVFNSINEKVFHAAIDDSLLINADQYAVSIMPEVLEEQVLAVVSASKHPLSRFNLDFNYYNIAAGNLDCFRYQLVCDGVQLRIATNIPFFFKERTYVYEIINQYDQYR